MPIRTNAAPIRGLGPWGWLAAATILVVMSNPFSAWTMQDDQRMFVDIGLSTVFLATAVLASFIATNVITREIDNGTVLTVVSKPVPRPIFASGSPASMSSRRR